MKVFRVFLGVALLILALGTTQKANAVLVQVPWTGSSTFTDETITFPGFIADSITDISGNGFVHSHTGGSTVDVDVILNGSSTTVFSTNVAQSDGNVPLSSFPFPLSFSQGTVTGVEFSATGSGQFHNFQSDEVITFNSPEPQSPSGVPEPSTLLLLGSGLAGLGGIVRRKNRKRE